MSTNEVEIFIHDDLSHDEIAFRRWMGHQMLEQAKKNEELLSGQQAMRDEIVALKTKLDGVYVKMAAIGFAFGLAGSLLGIFGKVIFKG